MIGATITLLCSIFCSVLEDRDSSTCNRILLKNKNVLFSGISAIVLGTFIRLSADNNDSLGMESVLKQWANSMEIPFWSEKKAVKFHSSTITDFVPLLFILRRSIIGICKKLPKITHFLLATAASFSHLYREWLDFYEALRDVGVQLICISENGKEFVNFERIHSKVFEMK